MGDSITWLSQNNIHAYFQNYANDLRSYPGATMAEAYPQLQDLLNEPQGAPQDLVINLGTNDVHLYAQNGETWRAWLYYESVAVQHVPCVIFVNVSTDADNFVGGQPIAEEVNAAIAQSVAVNPNFHLLDWNGFIHTAGNYLALIDPTSWVHPNMYGQQILADLYLGAVQQDCHN